jgi:hypothetical protein
VDAGISRCAVGDANWRRGPGEYVLRQQYMVSADGQRCLMSTIPDAISNAPITVIVNWKSQS